MKGIKESRYNIWLEKEDGFFVFNGMSGAILPISRSERASLSRLLSGDSDSGCTPELYVNLFEKNILLPSQEDELQVLRARYSAGCNNSTHFALTIVTSLGCNFDCPYCFEAKHPSIMERDVQQAVIRLLDDKIPAIDSFSVHWFGGEPLVGKKPLLELSDAFIERCDRNGVSYSARIITNGYLLNERTCAELRDRRVEVAVVTLDGPPKVHNVMRPLSSGKGSFWEILNNLRHAVNYFKIELRVNINSENISDVEALMQILAAEGFSGKLNAFPGHLVDMDFGNASPSASYKKRCLTHHEFADAELDFFSIARRYGLAQVSLPSPILAPCTAVRSNELVVGSYGELYKCYELVGNALEVIGDIRKYSDLNGRLHKWLQYDPLSDEECRNCIALPGCMGGCANQAMYPKLRDNRCDTFRHTYKEQIEAFVESGMDSRSRPIQINRRATA